MDRNLPSRPRPPPPPAFNNNQGYQSDRRPMRRSRSRSRSPPGRRYGGGGRMQERRRSRSPYEQKYDDRRDMKYEKNFLNEAKKQVDIAVSSAISSMNMNQTAGLPSSGAPSISLVSMPPVIRAILNPEDVKIPRRNGEGARPIFERPELKESIQQRMRSGDNDQNPNNSDLQQRVVAIIREPLGGMMPQMPQVPNFGSQGIIITQAPPPLQGSQPPLSPQNRRNYGGRQSSFSPPRHSSGNRFRNRSPGGYHGRGRGGGGGRFRDDRRNRRSMSRSRSRSPDRRPVLRTRLSRSRSRSRSRSLSRTPPPMPPDFRKQLIEKQRINREKYRSERGGFRGGIRGNTGRGRGGFGRGRGRQSSERGHWRHDKYENQQQGDIID